MKNPVRQAVVFPTDRESANLRKENAVMRNALKRIAEKDIWPDKTMYLYDLQSSIHIAEEALEEIEGD